MSEPSTSAPCSRESVRRLGLLDRIVPGIDEDPDHLDLGIDRLRTAQETVEVPVDHAQRIAADAAQLLGFGQVRGNDAGKIPALIAAQIEALEVGAVVGLAGAIQKRDVGVLGGGLEKGVAVTPRSADDVVAAVDVEVDDPENFRIVLRHVFGIGDIYAQSVGGLDPGVFQRLGPAAVVDGRQLQHGDLGLALDLHLCIGRRHGEYAQGDSRAFA